MIAPTLTLVFIENAEMSQSDWLHAIIPIK